jgi:hypothetical protein
VLLIPRLIRASFRKVVEPKETPAQDGVGVIVGVLVGSGVVVGVNVCVGVGVLVVVGVVVGVGMVIDEDIRQTESKVNVVSKSPVSLPSGVLLKPAAQYFETPGG